MDRQNCVPCKNMKLHQLKPFFCIECMFATKIVNSMNICIDVANKYQDKNEYNNINMISLNNIYRSIGIVSIHILSIVGLIIIWGYVYIMNFL